MPLRRSHLAASLLLACHPATPGPGQCVANADCGAGEVCLADTCTQLCATNSECDSGCCSEGACTSTCESAEAPQIAAVDGTGATDGRVGHAGHEIASHVVITGSGFDGAAVSLDGGSGPVDLVVCERASDRLEVELPPDVHEGTYTLTVANEAGACGVSVPILQGPKGDEGTSNIIAGSGIGVVNDPESPPTVYLNSASCFVGQVLTWTGVGTGWLCDEALNAPQIAADQFKTNNVPDQSAYGWYEQALWGMNSNPYGNAPLPGCSSDADRGKMQVMSIPVESESYDMFCFCQRVPGSPAYFWRCMY